MDESAAPLYRLDLQTRNLLIESAPLMEAWSKTDCGSKSTGGMEEWAKNQKAAEVEPVASCDWYHSTWQYLRLLNMVAVPPWYEFYKEALSDVLRRRPNAEVLISAAADYGMLATLHDAIRTSGASPHIVLYDICQTPIRACQWYAERHGLALDVVCANLLTCDIPPASFDLIVTDEFLTVIKSEDKPQIVKRWRELLKPGGTLVTTAMIGGPTTPELRRGYAERALRKLAENPESFPQHNNGHSAELKRRLELFASVHTRHMLKDEEEVRRLFDGFGNFSYAVTATPGECVNPTYSCQIVASVP